MTQHTDNEPLFCYSWHNIIDTVIKQNKDSLSCVSRYKGTRVRATREQPMDTGPNFPFQVFTAPRNVLLLCHYHTEFKTTDCNAYRTLDIPYFHCNPDDIDVEPECVPGRFKCDSIIDCSNKRDEIACEAEHIGKGQSVGRGKRFFSLSRKRSL